MKESARRIVVGRSTSHRGSSKFIYISVLRLGQSTQDCFSAREHFACPVVAQICVTVTQVDPGETQLQYVGYDPPSFPLGTSFGFIFRFQYSVKTRVFSMLGIMTYMSADLPESSGSLPCLQGPLCVFFVCRSNTCVNTLRNSCMLEAHRRL